MKTNQITNSSTIQEIGYDEETKTLYIIFKGSGKYLYYDVPKEVWEAMVKAKSTGKFFYREIKGGYEYDREKKK